MATNKHAIIRYKILDECFSNKYARYYVNDLIDTCSEKLSAYTGKAETVSLRTIMSDMKFMKSEAGYRAPLQSIRNGKRVYYQYDPIDFSILNQPLTEHEAVQIRQTLETLSRVKGMPRFEWVNAVQTKLSSGLELDHPHKPIIAFQENEYLKGLEFLEPLYQHILHKTALHIRYQSFNNSQPFDYSIHPWYLKQFSNRWFLFGKNDRKGFLQNIALDRIVDIKTAPEIAYHPTDIDFDEYFEDIVGVTHPSDATVYDIVLRFTEERLPYILSKPMHGSQRFKDGLVHLQLKINRELKTLIHSFGADVEVLQPEKLRAAVVESNRILAKKYQHTPTLEE